MDGTKVNEKWRRYHKKMSEVDEKYGDALQERDRGTTGTSEGRREGMSHVLVQYITSIERCCNLQERDGSTRGYFKSNKKQRENVPQVHDK